MLLLRGAPVSLFFLSLVLFKPTFDGYVRIYKKISLHQYVASCMLMAAKETRLLSLCQSVG